jgi:hypothetical protein
LTLTQQATFYSQWYFSAVRLAAGLENMPTADLIAARLRLPIEAVERALAFLVSARLLERHGDHYNVKDKRTHLSAESPLVAVHHRNWRAKAMSMYDHIRQTDFVFTAAVALSKDDVAKVRELLSQCVSRIAEVVEPSRSETLAVFNIDFLEL